MLISVGRARKLLHRDHSCGSISHFTRANKRTTALGTVNLLCAVDSPATDNVPWNCSPLNTPEPERPHHRILNPLVHSLERDFCRCLSRFGADSVRHAAPVAEMEIGVQALK